MDEQFPESRSQAERQNAQRTAHGDRQPRDRPHKAETIPQALNIEGQNVLLEDIVLGNRLMDQGYGDAACHHLTSPNGERMFIGFLCGPWDNSPLVYWQGLKDQHKSNPTGFVGVC